MSEHTQSFIQLSLRGYVMLDEIDDFVERWHEDPRGTQLHTFLGMSWDEYALWVASPDTLSYIIKARHEETSLTKVVNDNFSEYRLAARATDMAEVNQIQAWLREHGKID